MVYFFNEAGIRIFNKKYRNECRKLFDKTENTVFGSSIVNINSKERIVLIKTNEKLIHANLATGKYTLIANEELNYGNQYCIDSTLDREGRLMFVT